MIKDQIFNKIMSIDGIYFFTSLTPSMPCRKHANMPDSLLDHTSQKPILSRASLTCVKAIFWYQSMRDILIFFTFICIFFVINGN